ncbi:MAG: hypothetical protein PVS3B3_32340 [Ktedonobacteraceae bacterium]
MTSERQPTTEKLAQALIAAKAPQEMIDHARSGYYDDYKSDIGNNIMALVADAKKCNLTDIASRAMNGEFDAQDWEADEWAKSSEGQAVFAEFGHLLPK